MLLQLCASTAAAQTRPTGDVTFTPDFFPNRSNTAELRARVFAEEVLDPTPKLLMTFSGFAEGLLARRPLPPRFDPAARTDAILRVDEASVAYKGDRFDLLAGYTRVVWGRLDELQPTDVVNPLDVSRFFFEGRSEARLPVALVRARGHLSENASIEGVYVPFFRSGRFDQLDEPTSPFNIEPHIPSVGGACLPAACPTFLPTVVERREPANTLGDAQGGARFNATSGRVDWSVSAYRGFEPFGLARTGALLPMPSFIPIEVVHPRFTMVGGDFETVRGTWGLRGEIAAFVDHNFQSALADIVKGKSFDAGVGVDRKAGSYRISGTALLHREIYNERPPGDTGRTDLSLALAADRSFSRERYQSRTFAVYNASETSAFVRSILTAKLRDNVALEGSVGWFAGQGRDTIGRFADSDFGYARLKFYF